MHVRRCGFRGWSGAYRSGRAARVWEWDGVAG
jgi:hypothetical protein